MPTTKKSITYWFAALAALLVSQGAVAGHADTIQAALMEARSNLVSMIDATDKAAQDGFYAKVTRASKDVDAALEAALKDAATTADQAAKYQDFKAT